MLLHRVVTVLHMARTVAKLLKHSTLCIVLPGSRYEIFTTDHLLSRIFSLVRMASKP